MKKLFKSKKALSPVVASIILIAVTVAVSIAVAAWMGALTFTFMATEQVEFTNVAYASDLTTVDLTVKNTGTSSLTINQVLVNNRLNTTSPAWTASASRTLNAGASLTITVTANGYLGSSFVQGDNYAFTVVTSKNNQFGPYTKAAQ